MYFASLISNFYKTLCMLVRVFVHVALYGSPTVYQRKF